MELEESKEVTRRYFEVFNRRDMDHVMALVHNQVIEHPSPAGIPPGMEGFWDR